MQESEDLTSSFEKTASPVIGQIPPFAKVAAITASESQLKSLISRVVAQLTKFWKNVGQLVKKIGQLGIDQVRYNPCMIPNLDACY